MTLLSILTQPLFSSGGLLGSINILQILQTALAMLPAMILHEIAHGYAAYRLGDPTAKYMGRLSFNPLRHLDPLGTLLLLTVHIGWAKPVPINPNNFRHPRRDDLIVSVAGVTANLCMALAGMIVMYGILTAAMTGSRMYLGRYVTLMMEDGRYAVSPMFVCQNAHAMSDFLIRPQMGSIVAFVYDTVVSFVTINLGLILFNLLPIPPLDGYHVVNDLLLKRDLFVTRRIAQYSQIGLILLSVTGLLSKGLSYLLTGILHGTGYVACWLIQLIGLV